MSDIIKYQDHKDEDVIVNLKDLLQLNDERNEFREDLKVVAKGLMSFMRKLGCLDEENKLQKPRLGKMVGAVQKAMMNPEDGLFKDIQDLEPQFIKYAALVADEKITEDGK